MSVMSIIVLLALVWLAANAVLVLMLRRGARIREQGGARSRPFGMPRDAGNLAPARPPEPVAGRLPRA